MPEAQAGIAGSYSFIENVTIALEYLHGAYKEDDVEDRDIVMCQVSVEF